MSVSLLFLPFSYQVDARSLTFFQRLSLEPGSTSGMVFRRLGQSESNAVMLKYNILQSDSWQTAKFKMWNYFESCITS